MIIKFEDFLNEFNSYKGQFGTVGFKYSEPSNKYTLKVELTYDKNNDNIINNVLNKYDIPYENLKLNKNILSSSQLLDLTFFTYSELEATSIISSIIEELKVNNINFDPKSIEITPTIYNPFQRIAVKGFGK